MEQENQPITKMKIKGSVKVISEENNSILLTLLGSSSNEDSDIWINFRIIVVAGLCQRGDTIEVSATKEGYRYYSDEAPVVTQKAPKNQSYGKEYSPKSDDSVNYEALLAKLHEYAKENKFTIQMHSKIIPELTNMDSKYAVVHATVTIVDEQGNERGIFQGLGDCDQTNGGTVKDHFIRMAETRAYARALRWATNNAGTSSVEFTPGEKK